MSERKPPRRKRKAPTQTVVVAAFSEDHVARLTGVSKRQLRYWDADGFFVPSFAYADRSEPNSRVYSFRDVVSLKILNDLRNESKVPLWHLRDVKDRLRHLGDDLWAKTTLYVHNRRVVFFNPDTDVLEEVVSGQGVLQIPLRVVAGNMEEAVKAMRQREPKSIGKFEQKRTIAQNQVVIAGTRIPVRSIKAFADAGYTVGQIRKEYPTLTEEDILAAIGYVAAA